MNSSDLIAFLQGDLAAHALEAKLGQEVEAWSKRLSERGRSAPITLLGMSTRFDITPERARRLLDAFVRDEVSKQTFAYVLEALLLEERFQWTSVAARESMENVLGSSAPIEIDKRRAWRARAELDLLTTG